MHVSLFDVGLSRVSEVRYHCLSSDFLLPVWTSWHAALTNTPASCPHRSYFLLHPALLPPAELSIRDTMGLALETQFYLCSVQQLSRKTKFRECKTTVTLIKVRNHLPKQAQEL